MQHQNESISIPFKLVIDLEADLRDTKIKIKNGNNETNIESDQKRIIELDLCFQGDKYQIPLLEITGFRPIPGPKIKISRCLINGYDVDNFHGLLSFDMKDNAYVNNETYHGLDQINFNGVLNINIERHRDRLQWFPITYSSNRQDIVFRNDILNCLSEFGCWGENCIHDPPWKRFILDVDQEFDYVALGCSITAGSGIRKKNSWPSILSDNEKNKVLNLGVPGGGCDSILVNVRNLLDNKIKFKKMIILLPEMGRKLLRVKKHGFYFNLSLQPGARWLYQERFNLFFDKSEIKEILDKEVRKLVLSDFNKRDRRIISRLISYLESKDVDFSISSWSNEVYDVLKSCTDKKNLLPKFNEENDRSTGEDGSHPAEHIHEKWVRSIKSQVTIG